MRKILAILVATMMLTSLFAGCGNSQDESPEKNDAETIVEEVDEKDVEKARNDKKHAPDENVMTTDLIEQGANCFFLNYCDEYLNINSLEIVKRKTEDDYDTATVTATLENENYKVDAEYTLYYSFYDVGGWVLDDYIVDNFASEAKTPYVTDEEFLVAMGSHFSDCSIDNRSQYTNVDGSYIDNISFSSTIEYPYLTTHFIGEYTYTYSDNQWYENCILSSVVYDWSKVLGKWNCSSDAFTLGPYFLATDVSVEITGVLQVPDEKLQITYNYSSYGRTNYSDIENEILIDEVKQGQQTNRSVRYTTEIVLGNEIQVPERINSFSIPWLKGYESELELYLDRNQGLVISNKGAYSISFSKVN